MQRYSNLDTLSKTFRILRTAGLITPDGKPIPRSDRSPEPIAQPFKLSQRLAPSTINELIKHYKNGKSSYELAKVFDISKGSVIKLLRAAGIAIRNQGLTDGQIREAVELYASGRSLTKIGKHFGVEHGTIRRALKKRGVRMRDTHGRER